MPPKARVSSEVSPASFALRGPEAGPARQKQGPRSGALGHGKCGQRIVLRVKLRHTRQIDGAEHVDVVNEERLIGAGAGLKKKPRSLFQTPPVSSRTSSRETSILMPKFWLAAR